MYIHIGNKRIVSDRRIIGIFNVETMRRSPENAHIVDGTAPEHKAVIVNRNNTTVFSIVSPFTLIKRTALEDTVWSKTE
ncbi:MAG TPA: DUF370 domain-containing protein [Spirochaetota bacterium]|nr:DUF370 domain-containing protein [Spirochaetota bacterium]HNT09722.1 DUF370 domain-containing protein [Spirochaetota bacterium]HNV45635.1 DUF370 domain-containing protein [Spirochaetota bacterium]HPI21677.1 DUF370 domain-containing protein [Spirochaetota bacterium]HPU87243.1 DUF370 domain-containing protein [Spirochaetota bacterium]